MLLCSYSRCTLDNLPCSLALCCKTANSSLEPETSSKISSCSSHVRCEKSAPRFRAEWPDVRMACTQSTIQISAHASLIILHAEVALTNAVVSHNGDPMTPWFHVEHATLMPATCGFLWLLQTLISATFPQAAVHLFTGSFTR